MNVLSENPFLICKKILKYHGSNINIESKENEYTKVYFDLDI